MQNVPCFGMDIRIRAWLKVSLSTCDGPLRYVRKAWSRSSGWERFFYRFQRDLTKHSKSWAVPCSWIAEIRICFSRISERSGYQARPKALGRPPRSSPRQHRTRGPAKSRGSPGRHRALRRSKPLRDRRRGHGPNRHTPRPEPERDGVRQRRRSYRSHAPWRYFGPSPRNGEGHRSTDRG